jgi:hypothetical protein
MLHRIAASKNRVLISSDTAVRNAALENTAMAVTTTTTSAREPATKSIPEASKDVGGRPPEPAVPVQAAADTGSDMLQTISRMIYSGSYALAYGAVYAAVFVAQSLPQENPVMHGFRDGGGAAMDELNGN